MAAPKPPSLTAPGNNVPFLGFLVLVAAAITTTLLPDEGRKYTPYRDSAGILTVCMGIIGRDVVPGKTYTPAECDALEQKYIIRMVKEMAACLPADVTKTLKYGEWIAYGHWNYNTGAFCRSSLRESLLHNDHVRACQAMSKWTYITVRGRKVDCRDPANRCSGLAKRRLMETSMCLGALGG